MAFHVELDAILMGQDALRPVNVWKQIAVMEKHWYLQTILGLAKKRTYLA